MLALANVTSDAGDHPAARKRYDEALLIQRELGDRRYIALTLTNVGRTARAQGEYAYALKVQRESLEIARQLGDSWAIVNALDGLAAVIAALGGALRAARIWGAAVRIREEIGSPLPPTERQLHEGRVATARANSGDAAAFEETWTAGRGLTVEQAIEVALQERVPGSD